ncbi:MAG: Calx-beta domain-containing protein [Pseudomonas sp.]|uniref:Calx-beta domain-containing protein n=1 Tax=Pseudomonas sp. TaxID=306 RepID=UPI0027245169|nr:Calx-beta domain-containing protein [Pseudomonas sp.]MDO8403150.1 Calx-beta domain-containing protein [Pseudomonas sp.]
MSTNTQGKLAQLKQLAGLAKLKQLAGLAKLKQLAGPLRGWWAKVRTQKVMGVAAGLAVLVASGVVLGRMTADEGGGRQLLIVPRAVERRDLDDVLTISGEVRREEVQTINLPVDGKVSNVNVEDGETIEVGDSLFGLDGRASVAVPGDFAFYRTLDVGSDGPDVLQLERILTKAGYAIAAVDELFTEETRTALARWQVDHGYGGATPESTETITVGLMSNSAGYSVGKQNTVAFTIEPSLPTFAGGGPPRPQGTPDKPTIEMSANPLTVDEGGLVTFTFTASPAPANDTTIDLTIGGDATGGTNVRNGADYQSIDNSFTFPAGQTTVTLDVPVFVDQVIEDEEQITVSLTDQFGNDPTYVVGPANQARIRIRANGDDLLPLITVKTNGSVVSEGNTVTFTFTSTVESNQDIDLAIEMSGTAANGDDYVEVLTDDVTIAAGNTTATLQVQTRRDNVVEPDEQIVLTVLPEPGNPVLLHYQPGSPGSAVVMIESSDLPEITLQGGGRIAEGGAKGFSFVADEPVSENTSINYQVGGTASPGNDYETLTGTVIMRAGTSRAGVTIHTIDDDVVFLPSDMVVADWPARVGKVDVDEGEFVLQGSPVLTLTEPVFTVKLIVTATDRAKLEVGLNVMVSLDSSDIELPGAIATLDDAATISETGEEQYEGTVTVQGDLEAVDGARATIEVTLAERLDVLAVPVAAVLRSGGGDQVRVINDEGTITRVSVTIGLIDGEWVEITSGLNGDELVVVDVDPAADPGAGGG